MENYLSQIDRIKTKLEQAKTADKSFKVFGADSHRYVVNKPAKIDDIKSIENKYSIQIPECYKSFILQIGNGGQAHSNSAAGPFYGIYPLGNNIDELIYEDIEQYLGNECILKPGLSDNEWTSITSRIEDDKISDEEFDKELGKIYGGVLPIGSQGCTYIHGIILNGDYKGRIVNLDLDRQKPRFAFEKNFLDWYERWLDEVISGDLTIDSPSWFGYTMGGTDDELIKLYQSSTNIDEKKEALSGILNKKEISTKTLELIESKYIIEQENLAVLLLQILTKFDYSRAKTHLIKEGERNLLSVFQFIFWYEKDKASEWKEYIENNIIRINDAEAFRFCTYLIAELKIDYGYLINDFIRNDDDEIRSTVIYTLGQLKNKEKYLDTFILGLSDSSNKVIHSSLQALSGVKNKKLLKYYKIIAQKFPVEKDYILSNLNHRLKEFNLSPSKIKNIDIDSLEQNELNLKERKWYQIWK